MTHKKNKHGIVDTDWSVQESDKTRNIVEITERSKRQKRESRSLTEWRMSFEDSSTTFLFMAHSSSHSIIAF